MYMTEIILHMVTSFEGNSPTYSVGEVQSLLLTNMSGSVEYRTLSRCHDKLVTAFKLDAVITADTFISQSLISPTIALEMNELVTSEQKARRLVDYVFDQIKVMQQLL